MGLLDSNLVKSESIIKKNTLCVNKSLSEIYNFQTEINKDLIIEIFVNDTVDDNVTVAFSGTGYDGIDGNWLSPLFIPNQAISMSNNIITLKKGKTVLRLIRPRLNEYRSISAVTNVSNGAKLSISYYYNDSNLIEKSSLNGDNGTIRVANGKLYKLHIPDSSNVTLSSYMGVKLIDSYGIWSNVDIITDKNKTTRGYDVVIYPKTSYYIDLRNRIDSYTDILLTSIGGASCSYEITEEKTINYIPKTTLFTTTSSIGDALFYKRKIDDVTIVASVSVTNYVEGNNIISFSPRMSNNDTLGLNGQMIGTKNVGQSFNITSAGTYEIAFDSVEHLDKINVSAALMTGTEVTVEFYSLPYKIGVVSDRGISEYYSDNNILIEKYKENVRLYTHYENWEAWINSTNTILSIRKDSLYYEVIIAGLPNWKNGDSINVMGFIPYCQGGATAGNYSRETSVRLCMVTVLGNIYHNYPAADANDLTVVSNGISKFDLGSIYQTVYGDSSLSSERIPSLNSSLTSEEQKTHRYEPGLPAWNYQQHTENVGGYQDTDKTIEYGNGGQTPILNKKGYTHIRIVHPFDFGTNPQRPANPYQLGDFLCEPFAVKPKMTVFVPYVGINAKRNVILGTVDGGRSWYVLHELGIGSFMGKFGNSLNYSSIGTYVSGDLSVSERLYNYPKSDVKEPVNAFKYKAPVLISSIMTSGGKTTVTTSTAHGITDGMYIVFKKNNSGYFDFLSNTVVDGSAADLDSNSCGNGRFYAAKVLSSTTFELLQCMGGMDEKINAHHVHSANVSKDGVVISCGEQYPNGWVLYVPIHEIDDFEYKNIWAYKYYNPYVIRLNSSQNAVQRPVGFILNDDLEQSFLFASDEAHIDRGYIQITGRTDVMKRNSAGVFLGKLVDIDDISKTECVLELEETSLGLVKKQGFYIVLGMSRKTYISKDAKDWIEFPLVSKYQGEGIREIYFVSGYDVYKVSHK